MKTIADEQRERSDAMRSQGRRGVEGRARRAWRLTTKPKVVPGIRSVRSRRTKLAADGWPRRSLGVAAVAWRAQGAMGRNPGGGVLDPTRPAALGHGRAAPGAV